VTPIQRYAENIRALVRSLRIGNEVIFMDHRENVAQLMRWFDVIVIPSRREGFGLVTLEALASGVPLVTAKGVGAVEVLEGQPGVFVCDRLDASSLAENISEALQWTDSHDGGAPARLHDFASAFSWGGYARQFEAIYATHYTNS
jgi:glycosyltransferase involved in cell wall biosynthesis